MQYVLVTGSNGMLGRRAVEGLLSSRFNVLGISAEDEPVCRHNNYLYKKLDLTRCFDVEKLFSEYDLSHVIHLAAIAHTYKGMDNSWSRYYRINTMCSRTVFNCSKKNNIPVFFASTVDVYGIQTDEVNENTIPQPIGAYARSKYLAERELSALYSGSPYTIARFAPIYTEDNKKDIRKRYFLKYPGICYKLGNGTEYEFLSVSQAVDVILRWVNSPEKMCGIFNIRDYQRFNTRELINSEKAAGNAKIVITVPKFFAALLKAAADIMLSKKKFWKFQIYKILQPVITDNTKMISLISSECER